MKQHITTEQLHKYIELKHTDEINIEFNTDKFDKLSHSIKMPCDSVLKAEMFNIGKMIEILRENYQLDIYTVDATWHVQLFDIKVCANDDLCCDYETGWEDNELIDELFNCLIYMLESENDD